VPVTIRLARHGRTKLPLYRIVAADKQYCRDGRFLEVVGHYNSKANPAQVSLKEDRVRHWISVGAQTSELVRSLIKKQIPGFIEGLEDSRRKKVQDARKKRKQRAAAGKKTETKKK
jgi:small subunit ribosomal protein S16